MNNTYIFTAIAVISLITMALRFLPFIMFSGKKETPAAIDYLAKVLPYSIIGMLVVYCLKGINFLEGSHGIPEIIAVCAVVGLHIWKKNTLLSIAAGTALYMILVQNVF